MNKESEEREAAGTESSRRPSWPYPVFLILYVILFFITPITGTTIGLILFSGLIGVGVWNAVSLTQYEQLKKNYPLLSRADFVMNNLIFPVIVPLVVFVALVFFKMSASGR